eukprot:Gb_37390 [translate_table: standard]
MASGEFYSFSGRYATSTFRLCLHTPATSDALHLPGTRPDFRLLHSRDTSAGILHIYCFYGFPLRLSLLMLWLSLTPGAVFKILPEHSQWDSFLYRNFRKTSTGNQRQKLEVTEEESRGHRPHPPSTTIRSPNTSRRMSSDEEAIVVECCCMALGGMWITNNYCISLGDSLVGDKDEDMSLLPSEPVLPWPEQGATLDLSSSTASTCSQQIRQSTFNWESQYLEEECLLGDEIDVDGGAHEKINEQQLCHLAVLIIYSLISLPSGPRSSVRSPDTVAKIYMETDAKSTYAIQCTVLTELSGSNPFAVNEGMIQSLTTFTMSHKTPPA